MLSIQTNVNSLIAQENLNVNSAFQTKTIEQLTSGYRINSSSDDAAGLAVANQYRDQTAELTQGVRNANDGTSQLQIMDGGLNNISQMLDRLQTLATESASSTFTGNRTTLNTEYQGLLSEINRQADNIGLGANNSSNQRNISVYIGGGQDANTNSSVNVNLSTGSGVDATALGIANTNVLTNAAVTLGGGSAPVASAVQVGDKAAFTVQTASGQQVINIAGQKGDTVQSQINELNSSLQGLGIQASLNSSGQLQFQSGNAFSVNAQATTTASADTSNLVSTTAENTNNTSLYNLEYPGSSGLSGGNQIQITVGNTVVTATVASGANPIQSDIDSINSALKAVGVTTVSAVIDTNNSADFSLQGSESFTVGDDFTTAQTFSASPTAANAPSEIPPAGGNASAAINAISAALASLGSTQGKVGAGQNTVNYAVNLAQSQITNFSSAESQIRDADIAAEAANLSKAQVLQQSSMAAMAQANSAPQAVLKLLQ